MTREWYNFNNILSFILTHGFTITFLITGDWKWFAVLILVGIDSIFFNHVKRVEIPKPIHVISMKSDATDAMIADMDGFSERLRKAAEKEDGDDENTGSDNSSNL